MAYLHRYYYKKLSNNEIASYVNLSPDYFSRLFKRHTGITWQDYLTTKRIRVSKSLLNERSDSILTIALQIGYSDANYFSRVFKKNTGRSPNEYRKSLPK